MKIKTYLPMLIATISISPLTAFADIYFQNQTDSKLTVQYQYCVDFPQHSCTDPQFARSIPKQTAYDVPYQSPYTYVVAMEAYTDDGWKYFNPQRYENCGMIRFYISGVPALANFSKTYVKFLLQCQAADGLAKNN